MRTTVPTSLQSLAVLHLLAASVCAVSNITLCGQYENITDQTATYSCKSLNSSVVNLMAMYLISQASH